MSDDDAKAAVELLVACKNNQIAINQFAQYRRHWAGLSLNWQCVEFAATPGFAEQTVWLNSIE